MQFNGRVRGKIKVAADASQDQVKEEAMADDHLQDYFRDKTIVKVIYVPGRILNVVVK